MCVNVFLPQYPTYLESMRKDRYSVADSGIGVVVDPYKARNVLSIVGIVPEETLLEEKSFRPRDVISISTPDSSKDVKEFSTDAEDSLLDERTHLRSLVCRNAHCQDLGMAHSWGNTLWSLPPHPVVPEIRCFR